MIGEVASAQTARQHKSRRYTMTLTRWRVTISHPGAGAAELSRRIARCGAGSAIVGKAMHS